MELKQWIDRIKNTPKSNSQTLECTKARVNKERTHWEIEGESKPCKSCGHLPCKPKVIVEFSAL